MTWHEKMTWKLSLIRNQWKMMMRMIVGLDLRPFCADVYREAPAGETGGLQHWWIMKDNGSPLRTEAKELIFHLSQAWWGNPDCFSRFHLRRFHQVGRRRKKKITHSCFESIIYIFYCNHFDFQEIQADVHRNQSWGGWTRPQQLHNPQRRSQEIWELYIPHPVWTYSLTPV